MAFFGWKVYIIYDKARYIIGISHAWTHASNPSSWKIPVACPLTRRQTIKERSNDSQGKKERQCAFFSESKMDWKMLEAMLFFPCLLVFVSGSFLASDEIPYHNIFGVEFEAGHTQTGHTSRYSSLC